VFVKEWTMAELEPALPNAAHNRSFKRGKEAFTAAQCALCHRMGNDGGAVGPELTAVAARFNRRDLLENVVLPSKVISDRYQSWIITKRDGEDVSGVIAEETADKLVLMINALTQERESIPKKDIKERRVSTLSAMPEGLLNTLNREEILDLVAYLEAGGRQDAPVFAQAK
jgi:putative heme-binding domain-containing protein